MCPVPGPDDICDYFGVKIAMYFAWLGFYTSAMVYPAVLGSILYTFTDSDQVSARGVTSRSPTFLVGGSSPFLGFSTFLEGFHHSLAFPKILEGFQIPLKVFILSLGFPCFLVDFSSLLGVFHPSFWGFPPSLMDSLPLPPPRPSPLACGNSQS